MRRRRNDPSTPYRLRWPRWEAYQHATDGWIYPVGREPEWYDPTQEPALPTELARIARTYRLTRTPKATVPIDDKRSVYVRTNAATTKAIVSFLQRFGFLGQATLQEPQGLREIKIEGDSYFVPGDHFGWVFMHAMHVQDCLTLAGALNSGQNSDERKLARLVIRFIEETRLKEFPGLPWMIPTLAKTFQEVALSTLYKPNDTDTVKARALLRACLAPNLGTVERGYDPATGRSIFTFKALIQLIYWQLADWIDGGRLRRCTECQTYFLAEHGRQRFCPRPLARGTGESLCAKRFHMRGLRHPDKSQGEGKATM